MFPPFCGNVTAAKQLLYFAESRPVGKVMFAVQVHVQPCVIPLPIRFIEKDLYLKLGKI
jgi:hypothetical protein